MTDSDSAREAGRRRALLIGVRETRALHRDPGLAAAYPALDCVPQDIELMGAALKSSGYEVRSLHQDHPDPDCRDVGGNGIIGALGSFFASCEPGDTALVYLTCHGVTLGERHYLVPGDAQPGPARGGLPCVNPRTLLQTAPGELLAGLSRGVTVVVCLDACREDGAVPFVHDDERKLSGDHGSVVWLYSSSPGEAAYADAKGSWFGRALAEALSASAAPKTIGEVFEYVGTVAGRAARDGTVPPRVDRQVPDWSWESARSAVVCDGSETTHRWTEAAAKSALWNVTVDAGTVREPVLDRLRHLVQTVVGLRTGALARHPDPWDDPRYPERLIGQLGELAVMAGLREDERLSPPETAALLAAPIVHEGIVALLMDELGALPTEDADRGAADGATMPDGRESGGLDAHTQLVRSELRDMCRAHHLVRRTAATLRERGQHTAARAADLWLRHRFVADWDLIWEYTGRYPSAEKLFDLAVSAVLAATPVHGWCGPVTQSRDEVGSQLRQVLGHVSVRPGGSPRINDPDAPDGWNDHPPVQGTRWRGEQLATLLWAAALLAVDTRVLSSVLVDHLAARTPLSPSDAVISLSEGLRYEPLKRKGEPGPERHGVEVSFRCPHPALHAAVEELAARADTAFREIHRHHQGRAPLLRGLPRRVSTGLLKPRDRKYTEPLERFRLAEDEIRPLLMGTQLYGDPMLAVRELYQNALDACRYREMRVRYGRIRRSGHSDDWQPRIVFRQGVDEEARPYIECEDNGSGMTREKLTSMFARAGRRYEQDPDFVQERRNWRRAGLSDVHLNSRFGIGVFSYFMLAEEVEVRTCPVDRYGEHIPQEQLRADIQSGSGLLQIRQERGAPRFGGTRVRLYLAHRDGPRPSLLDTLESLLWFSDYDVVAVERAEAGRARSQERSVTWQAGQLRPSRHWPGDPVRAHGDAWFVQGKGQVLLDGVVVREAPAVSGYIVNLRERYEPVPSVDRNRLLSYDREQVHRILLEHAGAVAGEQGWKKVSLKWLWRLAKAEPRLAVRLVGLLLPGAAGFAEPEARSHKPVSVSVPLARAGVLPWDRQILGSSLILRILAADRSAETGVVVQWRRRTLGVDQCDAALSFTGYPEPAELDSLLFLEGLPGPDWAAVVRASAAAEIPVAEAVRALRRYAIAGLEVPETPDIRALRSVRPDGVAADVYECYRESFRSGPAHWGPPSLPLNRLPAQHAPLLMAAALSRVPLSRTAEALTQLSVLDNRLPAPPSLGTAGARTVSSSEATALAGFEGSGVAERLKLRSTRARAADPHATEIPGASLDQIRALREDVGEATVGPISPTAPAVAELDALGPWLLSRDLDGAAPWLGADPGLRHVLRASQRLKLPVGEVVERINRCSAITGIRGPDIPARSAGWRVPDWLQHALRRAPRARGPRLGPWLLSASWYTEADPDEAEPLEETLSHLAELGLLEAAEVQPVISAIRARHPQPKILAGQRSYSPIGQADLDGAGATGAQILALAAGLSLDLAAARALLLREARQYGLPLRAPELTGPAAAVRPREQDRRALCDDLDPDRFLERLTIGAIVQHALGSRRTVGASARRLAVFAGAGAPEPPGTLTRGEAPGLLDELTPIKADQAAFDAGLLGPGTLGALELVLVSGRFGWSLAKTYERYAPFAELGLDVTVRAPEGEERDAVPDWRDVIVLTERLTGRAPALSGTVDPDHVLLCSEETDLSPAGVLERLTRYAGLFGLTLPDPPRTTGAP